MEPAYSQLIAIFLFGAVLEAALLVRNSLSRLRLFFLIASAGAAFFLLAMLNPFGSRVTAVIGGVWLAYFVATFPFIFKIDVLQVVSRRSLAGLTVIFWYVYLAYFLQVGGLSYLLGLAAAVFTAATLVLSAGHWHLHKFWRLVGYAWFLLILLSLLVFQLNLSVYGYFLNPAMGLRPTAYGALVAGMAAFYLGINLWYALGLVPTGLLHKSRSTAYALWEWKLNLDIFSYKYHNEPLKAPLDALAVAIVCALILLVNKHFGWLPDYMVIDMLLLWFSLLSPNTKWAFH